MHEAVRSKQAAGDRSGHGNVAQDSSISTDDVELHDRVEREPVLGEEHQLTFAQAVVFRGAGQVRHHDALQLQAVHREAQRHLHFKVGAQLAIVIEKVVPIADVAQRVQLQVGFEADHIGHVLHEEVHVAVGLVQVVDAHCRCMPIAQIGGAVDLHGAAGDGVVQLHIAAGGAVLACEVVQLHLGVHADPVGQLQPNGDAIDVDPIGRDAEGTGDVVGFGAEMHSALAEVSARVLWHHAGV